MVACTFFGHRDCQDEIKPKLRAVLADLIENHNVDMFYVGHQGQFDAIVHRVLKELKAEYPTVNYAVVLAYMPSEKTEYDDYSDTMLPEGIESAHPRYAISWRNNWMLQQSNYVVAYVTHPWGGAYKYAEKAKRQGKCMIFLQE
jgi:uncharacterized phage-like protein YoqJ